MRVVHWDFSAVWRGGQQQLLLLALELKRMGFDQTLVLRPGAAAAAVAERYRSAGLLALQSGSPWALRRLARSAAVAHAHDGRALGWMLAASAGPARPRLLLTRRVAFPLRAPGRWMYRRLDAIAAVSRFVAARLVEGGVDPRRVHVVPDAIDRFTLPDAACARREIRAQLGLDDVSKCLLCLSAFTPEKGVPDLIEALALLPAEFLLLLTGDGDSGPLQSLAQRRGVLDRLRFAHRPAPPDWVAAADVLIVPSHAEGLGSALLLGMALDRPLVATRVGGIPELIEDGITGRLVPSRNPQALAMALSQVFSAPEATARMVAAARAALDARHTPAAMANATAALYAGEP